MAGEQNYIRVGIVQGAYPDNSFRQGMSDLGQMFGRVASKDAVRTGAREGYQAGLDYISNIARDEDGNLAPIDEGVFDNGGGAYGEAFNNAILQSYSSSLIADGKRRIDDIQRDNFNKPDEFQKQADAYIGGLVGQLPDRLKSEIGLTLQETRQQGLNNINQNVVKAQKERGLARGLENLGSLSSDIHSLYLSGEIQEGNKLISQHRAQVQSLVDLGLLTPLEASNKINAMRGQATLGHLMNTLNGFYGRDPETGYDKAKEFLEGWNGEAQVFDNDDRGGLLDPGQVTAIKSLGLSHLNNRKSQDQPDRAERELDLRKEHALFRADMDQKFSDNTFAPKDVLDIRDRARELIDENPAIAENFMSLADRGQSFLDRKARAATAEANRKIKILEKQNKAEAFFQKANAEYQKNGQVGSQIASADPNEVNKHFDNLFPDNIDFTDRNTQERIVQLSAATSVVPSRVNKFLEQAMTMQDPDLFEKAVGLAGPLVNNPSLRGQLTDVSVGFWKQMEVAQKLGLDLSEAAKMARIDPQTISLRQKEFSQDPAKLAEFREKTLEAVEARYPKAPPVFGFDITSDGPSYENVFAPGAITEFFREEGFFGIGDGTIEGLDWLARNLGGFANGRDYLPPDTSEFEQNVMDRAIRKASASHTSVESNVEDAAEELAVYYSTSLFARGNAPDEDSPIPQAELTRYAIEKVYGGLPGADDRGYYIAQWLEDKIKKSFDAGDIPEGLYHVGNPRDMVRQGRVWTTIVPGTEGMKVQYDEKGKAFAGPLYMIHYYDQAGQRQTLRQNGEYAAFRPYMTGDAAVDEQRAREIDRTAKERAARSMQKLTRKGGFDRLVTTIYPFAEEILYFRHRWQDDDLQ